MHLQKYIAVTRAVYNGWNALFRCCSSNRSLPRTTLASIPSSPRTDFVLLAKRYALRQPRAAWCEGRWAKGSVSLLQNQPPQHFTFIPPQSSLFFLLKEHSYYTPFTLHTSIPEYVPYTPRRPRSKLELFLTLTPPFRPLTYNQSANMVKAGMFNSLTLSSSHLARY